MNYKYNEAFEKWRLQYISTHTGYFKMAGTDDLAQVVWQAAIECEKAKSQKLVDAVNYALEWSGDTYAWDRLNQALTDYSKEI